MFSTAPFSMFMFARSPFSNTRTLLFLLLRSPLLLLLHLVFLLFVGSRW
jgi:hypothetical protein